MSFAGDEGQFIEVVRDKGYDPNGGRIEPEGSIQIEKIAPKIEIVKEN